MATFKKQEDCPPSERLLAYQSGEMETEEARSIGSHLSTCEFCTAEVAFYERYPVSREADEDMPQSKMPKPLFELAESLLNRRRGEESMDEILKQLDAAVHDRR